MKILEEVIDRYPIDGVFFNMIGYVQADYSYNYFGICQCQNCRKRFASVYEQNLPVEDDPSNPIYLNYENFKIDTVKELFLRRVDCVKQKNPNIAICNYMHNGSDIFRKESFSRIDAPLPEWNYHSTENVKTVLGSWEGMAVCNSAVHFLDYAMRHSGVSPHLTNIRLVQDMVYGGWLDFFVMGALERQDDKTCFDDVKDIFAYHQKNESYYENLTAISNVCLVVPEKSRMFGSYKEFKGLFRILAESHILFDVMHDVVLDSDDIQAKLRKYQAVILPDVRSMSDSAVAEIDRYVREGGKLLVTGETSSCDMKGNRQHRIRLQSLGIKNYTHKPKEQGAYFKIREQDKTKLRGFEKLNIVYLSGEVLECETNEGTENYFGLIPSSMFGPPEKAYYTNITDIPGMIFNQYGEGSCVYLPWHVGQHYEKVGNHAHSMVICSAINDLLQIDHSLETSATPLVELTLHHQSSHNRYLISAVNLSGQLGTMFHKPLPISNITISAKLGGKPVKVYGLNNENKVAYKLENGCIQITIDHLDLFETVAIDLEP